MTTHIPADDPELAGITAALLRAQEEARRLAVQTDTPFIVRQAIAKPGNTPAQQTNDLR